MAQGKKLKAAYEKIDRTAQYPLAEAISLIKDGATSKFDETIEIAMNLGIDPRHSDQMVRGVVALPHGTGKTMRVAVFARDDKADEAKSAGADVVGAEDLAEEIQNGRLDFDRVIATPDMMGVVGRLGKILGTKGLMPNPKLGTVTPMWVRLLPPPKLAKCSIVLKRQGLFMPVSVRPALPLISCVKMLPSLLMRSARPARAVPKVYLSGRSMSAPPWALVFRSIRQKPPEASYKEFRRLTVGTGLRPHLSKTIGAEG